MYLKRLRTFMTVLLLLAACGLAGHFAMDALCGSYIVTEHECHERQRVDADVLDCSCCTHPGSMLPTLAATMGSFAFVFHFSLMQPPWVSAAIRPLFPPPRPVSSAVV